MDQKLIVGLLARTALFGSLEQAPNVSELSGRPPRRFLANEKQTSKVGRVNRKLGVRVVPDMMDDFIPRTTPSSRTIPIRLTPLWRATTLFKRSRSDVQLLPDQMAPEHLAHQAFLRHVGPMKTSSPIAECIRLFLKNNTFLGGLPDNALDVLIPRGHVKKYAKGEVIYRRHDPGDSLMMVLAGRIKITNVNADGKEVVLAFAAPGDLNGEMAVLDGKERTANVTAVEHSEVFVLHRRDLLPILSAHPQVMFEMMQILCEKLRLASAIIEDSTLEMRNRTAKGLLRLAQQFGRRNKNGIRLDLIVSQSELGEYLSLSRANVSRQLGRLREANVIKLEGTQLIIIDEKGLSEIAEATTSKN